MKTASLLVLLLLVACTETASVVPNPPGPTDGGGLVLAARIDGSDYRASPGMGFDHPAIEVAKGGIRLAVTVENDGGLDAPLTSSNFEVRFAGSEDGASFPSRVEFTRYDAFSGALYWIAPGQSVNVWIGLWHRGESHWDAGPYAVTLTRRSHDDGAPALR